MYDGLLSKVPTDLLIDGRWRKATSGQMFAVENPATGATLVNVADAHPEDGVAALDAAVAAQASWAATAPRVRGELLRAAFETVIARKDDFAQLITLEMGKSLAESAGEVAYGAEFLRWFSEEAVRERGTYVTAPDGNSRLLTHKRPVGPCLLITPWNFPLAMATRKIGPALAAGCTAVIKPAELTPLTTLLLAQVFQDVGLPAGVLNVVPTTRASAVTGPLLHDSRLRKLSFTGSTQVGRLLLREASDQVLRVSMELGGNNPFLVFEDADLGAAVEGALLAKMRNIGQACTAANRFIVHEAVAGEFSERLAEAMSAMPVGDGTDPNTKVGPLIEEKARVAIQERVDDAVAGGARVLTGGAPLRGAGYFYPPTVVVDVPSDSRLNCEEIFGPVAAISTFGDEGQAIAMANATEFGLASFAYTRDHARVLRLTESIEAGMLGINTGIVSNPAAPFGGIKQSGLGREGGGEGIDEYLETRYVGLANPYA